MIEVKFYWELQDPETFTMAKIIEDLNRPALILAPNKTLAAQLYGEMKSFFQGIP